MKVSSISMTSKPDGTMVKLIKPSKFRNVGWKYIVDKEREKRKNV